MNLETWDDRLKSLTLLLLFDFMQRLVQVYAERYEQDGARNSFQLRDFFQSLMDAGSLRAYLVEMDKKTVLSNTPKEIVIKTAKGPTLTPVKRLDYNEGIKSMPPTILQYPSASASYGCVLSHFDTGYSSHDPTHTIYHSCVIQRLPENCDITKVRTKYSIGGGPYVLDLPADAITDSMNIGLVETQHCHPGFGLPNGGWKTDSTKVDLKITGIIDKLFAQTLVFLKS